MTRTEYLAELEKYLKKLPRKDYEETMDYFTEYFDEVGPEGEAAAIADLGSPKEAAHEIMLNLLDKKVEEDNQDSSSSKNTKNIVQIAILSILAAPLAIPLFIVAALLTFVFFLLVFIFALVMAIGAFAFFIFGISLIWDTLTVGLTTSQCSSSGTVRHLLRRHFSCYSVWQGWLCQTSSTFRKERSTSWLTSN